MCCTDTINSQFTALRRILRFTFQDCLFSHLLKKPTLDKDNMKITSQCPNSVSFQDSWENYSKPTQFTHKWFKNIKCLFSLLARSFTQLKITFPKIHSDTLSPVDDGKITMVNLLDLSAAFQHHWPISGLEQTGRLDWLIDEWKSRWEAVKVKEENSWEKVWKLGGISYLLIHTWISLCGDKVFILDTMWPVGGILPLQGSGICVSATSQCTHCYYGPSVLYPWCCLSKEQVLGSFKVSCWSKCMKVLDNNRMFLNWFAPYVVIPLQCTALMICCSKVDECFHILCCDVSSGNLLLLLW